MDLKNHTTIIPVHAPFSGFALQNGDILSLLEITHIPYTGPFTEHHILSLNDKELKLQFGTGGFYSNVIREKIIKFFNLGLQDHEYYQLFMTDQYNIELSESEVINVETDSYLDYLNWSNSLQS